MTTIRWQHLLATAGLFLVSGTSQALSIVGSKHDLSTNQPQEQICVYCHTPHGANQQAGLGLAPLWNRQITNPDAFIPYSSPTMTQTCPDRPSGSSMVCLSCHDGTQASGESAVGGGVPGDQHLLLNPANEGPAPYFGREQAFCDQCHNEPGGYPSDKLVKLVGPNLNNDHPVSMPFPTGNTFYNTPSNPVSGWTDVKLYAGRVECPSCHNVHNPENVPFLRKANAGSNLCLTCHNK